MRRLVWPGVAWLLVAVSAPLAAQRAGDPPAPRLEEPRPAPAFPAALVPFSIPTEWCRGGEQPRVTLRVFNVAIRPVHVLRVRGRNGALLSQLPLRCGNHVAIWNGSIDEPPRLPLPGVFYLQLMVEKSGTRTQLRTLKMAVSQ